MIAMAYSGPNYSGSKPEPGPGAEAADALTSAHKSLVNALLIKPSPGALEILASLSREIENRFYKNSTIVLDGYSFKNCGFHNCVLVTNTGMFTLEGCGITDCTLQFGENAQKIIRFWHIIAGLNPRYSAFNPQLQPDGTYTIK
jgi:hypothetical protein